MNTAIRISSGIAARCQKNSHFVHPSRKTKRTDVATSAERKADGLGFPHAASLPAAEAYTRRIAPVNGGSGQLLLADTGP